MPDHDPFAPPEGADTSFAHERWAAAGATEEEIEALANHHGDQPANRQAVEAKAMAERSTNEIAEALSVMRGEDGDDPEAAEFEAGLFVDTPKRSAPEVEDEGPAAPKTALTDADREPAGTEESEDTDGGDGEGTGDGPQGSQEAPKGEGAPDTADEASKGAQGVPKGEGDPGPKE